MTMVNKERPHASFAKNLMATGVDRIPDGYSFKTDPLLHAETTTNPNGTIASENYYKNWDSGTETFSNLAVSVAYNYTGNKLFSQAVTFYYDDDTTAFTDTTEFKVEALTKKLVKVRTRT